MTGPRYIVARWTDYSRSAGDPPAFLQGRRARNLWTDNAEKALSWSTAKRAGQIAKDCADLSAGLGYAYTFAVIEEIDTPDGPAHRELTPDELARPEGDQ